MKNKDNVIAGQAQLLSQLRDDLEEVKRQTAHIGSKDAIIVQQSEAVEKLQRAVQEANKEIEWLQVCCYIIFIGWPTHSRSSGQQGIRDTGIK